MSNLAVAPSPLDCMIPSTYTYKYTKQNRTMLGLDRVNDTGYDINEIYDHVVNQTLPWEFIGVGFFVSAKGVTYQQWTRINTRNALVVKSCIGEMGVHALRQTLIGTNPKDMYDFLVVAKPYCPGHCVSLDDVLHNLAVNEPGTLNIDMLLSYYNSKWK